jgi:hypothetical protein
MTCSRWLFIKTLFLKSRKHLSKWRWVKVSTGKIPVPVRTGKELEATVLTISVHQRTPDVNRAILSLIHERPVLMEADLTTPTLALFNDKICDTETVIAQMGI